MVDEQKSQSFAWDADKNALLKKERGFGFEDLVLAIEEDGPLDDISHPSPSFAHQRILVVALQGYAIVVPYVNDGDTLFLKTAYASRRATKTYLTPST